DVRREGDERGAVELVEEEEQEQHRQREQRQPAGDAGDAVAESRRGRGLGHAGAPAKCSWSKMSATATCSPHCGHVIASPPGSRPLPDAAAVTAASAAEVTSKLGAPGATMSPLRSATRLGTRM